MNEEKKYYKNNNLNGLTKLTMLLIIAIIYYSEWSAFSWKKFKLSNEINQNN